MKGRNGMNSDAQGSISSGSETSTKSIVFEQIRVRPRREGEIVPDGVSFSESGLRYFVAIRRNNNIMWIAIPKDNPQAYYVDVSVMNKWHEVIAAWDPRL